METLYQLRKSLIGCNKCTLSDGCRSQVVFGCGSPESDIMWIGEGPGAEEDKGGEPFSGPAGRLLMKMGAAIGYSREQMYLDNVVKCRPDNNRKPTKAEAIVCSQHIKQQIEILRPYAIVLIGGTAAEHLLGKTQPMKYIRGYWYEYKLSDGTIIPTRVIWHPAYLLRLQGADLDARKDEAWVDLKAVKERVDSLKGNNSISLMKGT